MTDINYELAAEADDGYCNPTRDAFNSSIVISVGLTQNATHGFFRFTGVTIPAGATITAASLTVNAHGVSGSASNCHMRIYAEDTAAPTAPTNAASFNSQFANKTTAYVDWDPSAWVANTSYVSPDIKTVIQKLVESYDYSSGSAIQLFLADDSSTDFLYIHDYGDANVDTQLDISYTVGGYAYSQVI